MMSKGTLTMVVAVRTVNREMCKQIKEDLSLPQVILVESTWIRGLHGCSMDSMEFFLAVDTPKFSFSVHGQSTYYHDFYNFHGIHADSPWTPHGLSPRIIHGWHRTSLLNKSLVIIISCNPRIPYGLSLH